MSVIINIDHVTDQSTFYESYGGWGIMVRVESGWLFKGDGTIGYEDVNGVHHNETLSVNGAKTMLSGTFYDTDANTVFTVNGEVKDENEVDIYNDIPNSTAKVTKDGNTANFEVTADTDYKFASDPKVTYTSEYGYQIQGTLTLNADETVATGSADYPQFNQGFTFSGETVSTGTPELTVNNGIAGTTETHSYDGETATLTVQGSYPRYRFIAPKVTYTDKLGAEKTAEMTVEVQQYGSVATAVLTDVDRLHPKKIVVVSSSPQVRYPDYYGIDMSRMGEFCAFRAAVSLLKQRGMEHVLEQVYRECLAMEKATDDELRNCVKAIYAPFTDEEISDEIARMLTPADTQAEVCIIYQSIEGLRKAVPDCPGDWYFSGDYPTPGGTRLVNRAFVNYYEGNVDKR